MSTRFNWCPSRPANVLFLLLLVVSSLSSVQGRPAKADGWVSGLHILADMKNKDGVNKLKVLFDFGQVKDAGPSPGDGH
ncbi:hypothetical protein HPP92_004344 [Vanilla planifolia]|uniref:Uncharacterized protein n=1 Tax=Vanilla planifolia TaxID=51239 RepID=A0A835P874_VANPL|nr:hypothetical protein HPP92_027900 [Vanilla planifolia]KAG0448324.1 hypothetical protein HPP92_027901 [Vanilla planifolia]KAG0493349.1 hypothetical protein HPP92_004343 [Vanilla planifolia]KAG0493350.1 hypothetical protein HPP92_004344 [Vanilla planifolia]